MKKNRDIRNRRIIFYYLVAIVFPSIILGVLAFRGIRNDQALVEREQMRELKDISVLISSEINNRLDSIEKSLKEYLFTAEVPETEFFSDSNAAILLSRSSLLKSVFYQDAKERINLIRNNLLFIPDEQIPAIPVPRIPLSDFNELGWKYEFRQKNYAGAISYYKNKLRSEPDSKSKAGILNDIARNQKKAGQNLDAIDTYRQIHEQFAGVYITEGIPLGISSLIETIKISSDYNDLIEAQKSGYILVNELNSSKYILSESFFYNTLDQAGKLLADLDKSFSEGSDVYRINKENIKLLDSLRSKAESDKHLLDFHANPGNTGDLIISYIGNQGIGGWGIILFADSVLKDVIYPILQSFSQNRNYNFQISGISGNSIYNSSDNFDPEISQSIEYPLTDPLWSIHLMPGDRSGWSSFLMSGNGVFVYIFILILILLVFGLFFTLKTIRNELELARMKSFFITTVSHEFKSPLASIRQLAEMLDQDRVRDEERKKVYYSGILSQSERLSHLIENILDFSRMEEGRKEFHFEKGNIADFLNDVILSYEKLVAHKGFKFSIDVINTIPDTVFDKDSMEQVMVNLLDNACKYSETSNQVEVSAELLKSQIVIKVKDHGIGIHKEDQDKIFSRFYRAGDVLTQKIKGTGIGLTIVKQIVIAHKGEIVVESEPGKGSTFSVILPVTLNKST